MSNHVFGGRYALVKKIGAGSFGEIYFGEDRKTKKNVAIKVEQLRTPVPQLNAESKIYNELKDGVNVCSLYYFGIEINTCAMVIDFLGSSLEKLRVQCGGTLSLKTVLMIADQMLCAIEFMHRHYYIHRDIKPDNFMFGTGKNSNQLYIIDFGLAKLYRDPKTLKHIPFSENNPFAGTARYASASSLRGIENSRRDDLESIAYVLAYLLNGNLPWMSIEANSIQGAFEKNVNFKIKCTPEKLFEGYPHEFANFLKDVKKLKFQDEPNYALYRKMFRDLMLKLNYTYDYQYDWVAGAKNNKIGYCGSSAKIDRLIISRQTKSPRKNIPKQGSGIKIVRRKTITKSSSVFSLNKI